ncbi:hypothetical protein CC86DRAFT_407935 [Ophiobolus disseminans]|uniref:Uncharacterized protein n=1 Tax=Ophiobolus disseminans TaxID=1469910 RepID=A0A6A6ZWS7_9PLEO|nr:hypothetical protein CC86DRAFT_407935 [Ophiobolus disseminans]
MKLSAFIAVAGLTAGIQGCFFTVHSSTVGNFNVQKSEPKGAFHTSLSVASLWKLAHLTRFLWQITAVLAISFSISRPGRFVRDARDAEITSFEE